MKKKKCECEPVCKGTKIVGIYYVEFDENFNPKPGAEWHKVELDKPKRGRPKKTDNKITLKLLPPVG